MGLFDQQPSDKDLLIQFLKTELEHAHDRIKDLEKTMLAMSHPASYSQRYPREQAFMAARNQRDPGVSGLSSPGSGAPSALRNTPAHETGPSFQDIEKDFEMIKRR